MKDHLIFHFYSVYVPLEYFRPHKTWHFIIYGEFGFILFNCAKRMVILLTSTTYIPSLQADEYFQNTRHEFFIKCINYKK